MRLNHVYPHDTHAKHRGRRIHDSSQGAAYDVRVTMRTGQNAMFNEGEGDDGEGDPNPEEQERSHEERENQRRHGQEARGGRCRIAQRS